MLLWNKRSLARLIRNSLVFQQYFVDHQTAQGTARPIKNLAYAKQRFDSMALPLARLVQHFDAALQVACDVLRERGRSTPEHIGAALVVDTLDNEAMLQMGMMADCADEVVRLTRFFDSELYDHALVAPRLAQFRATCEYLFAGGGCLTHEGHTKAMVTHILRPRMVLQSTGLPKTLGDVRGVSSEIVARCLARMQNWWQLASLVLATEFPDYSVLHAFSAFSLTGGGSALRAKSNEHHVPADTLAELGVLADLFQVDPVGLAEEFALLRPVAADVAGRSAATSNADAWAEAIARTQVDGKRRKLHRVGNLLPVLRRYVGYAASSSGVEQLFSRAKHLVGELRNVHGQTKQRLITLATMAPDTERDLQVCVAARLIWSTCFGAPRARRRMALPRRTPKRKLPGTESANRLCRTADLAARVGTDRGMPKAANRARSLAGRLWTAKQAAEATRQVNLREEFRLDSIRGEGAEGAEHREARDKKHAAYLKEKAKFRSLRRRTDISVKPGDCVYVAESSRQPGLAASFAALRVRQVDDRVLAQVFVVRDPARPDGRTALVASLYGAILVSPAFFLSPPGTAVRLSSALRLLRRVYVSEACREQHAEFTGTLQRCIAGQRGKANKWRMATDLRMFISHAKARSNKAGKKEYVALLTPGEHGDRRYRGLPTECKWTVSSFARQLSQVDVHGVLMGACGR